MQNRLNYRKKLIISFILVSLLPVVVVQLITYYVASEAMREKIDELIYTNLSQTSKNLETSIRAFEDIDQQIVINDEVIRLTQSVISDNDNLEIAKRQLINLLASYSYAKEGIRSVSIFLNNGKVITYDRQTGSPYEGLWSNINNVTELPIYVQAMESRSTIITEPLKIGTINNSEQYGFHIAKKIVDYNNLRIEGMGVAVITVYESVLAKAIHLSEADHTLSNPIHNNNYLVNQNGMIVSAADKEIIGIPVADVSTKSTITNVYPGLTNGLSLYNLVDQDDLFNEMYTMRKVSILTGIFAMTIAGWFIYVFSDRLTKSIRSVVRAMKVAQKGMLTVQVPSHENGDEISHIAFSFNQMMNRVNELMNEMKEAGEKQKEAEIRALEAQINPHFLFNTLDSINWLAIEKDEHQISHMLKGLGQILRYSIKDSNKRVTVQEELEWMDRYIYLQQFRFRSSFSFEPHCDEAARTCILPKLLLQPLLENAIIHGFEGMKQGGLLRIDISISTAGSLAILISDNGKGMEETKRQSILDGVSGIGFRNVVERLDIYYGQRATFELISRPGQGTTIEIEIPILEEEGMKP